jgi:energy-coupling factor transporter transmembrane protein EcfT
MIHPGTRILAFAVFVAAVVTAGPAGLALSAGLALCLTVALHAPAQRLRGLVRRSRWLFLSIAVVYLWFTPGDPLVVALGPAAPTVQGLTAGVQRVGALAVIIVMVNVLIASTTIEGLVTGIAALTRPFRVFGLSPERFALRVALTLHYAMEFRPAAAPAADGGTYRDRLGARLDAAWRGALRQADMGEPAVIELPPASRPGVRDAALLAVPLLLWLL